MNLPHWPWNVYAEELFPAGHGHPLCPPDSRGDQRELSIGDVGWLRQGEFRPLFNSMKPPDDPINAMTGVPPDFEPFNPRNLSLREGATINHPVVHSRGIHLPESRGEDTGLVAPVPAGTGFRFQSTADSGAFAFLESPGISKDIESRRRIVNYVRDNFKSWLSHSQSWGLNLKDQDLMFVCGTTKTTLWALAAFQSGRFKNQEGSVTASFGPRAEGISVCIGNETLPSACYRHGPTSPQAYSLSASSSSPHDPTAPNQCLFIHYYKMKRRFWQSREPMQAAAGPHQLPPGPDDPGSDYVMSFQTSSHGTVHERGVGDFDPVNHLLDYILQNSSAEVAIASDSDLTTIFMDYKFPEDVPAALRYVKPIIDVDERGVGTISTEYHLKRKRTCDYMYEYDDSCSKRARMSADYPCNAAPDMMAVAQPYRHSQWEAPLPPHAMGSLPRHMVGQLLAQTIGVTPPPSMEAHVGFSPGSMYPFPPPDPMCSRPPGSAYCLPSGLVGSMSPGPIGLLPPDMGMMGLYPPAPSDMQYQHPDVDDDGEVDDEGDDDNAGDLDDDDAGDLDNDSDDDSDDGDDADTPTSSSEQVDKGKRRIGDPAASIHEGSVTSMVYSPDGMYAASGAEDTSIIIWDTRDSTAKYRVDGHQDSVSALAFSRDNTILASASYDEEIVLWWVSSGQEYKRLSPEMSIHALVYTPDGSKLIAGASDGSLFVYDTENYELRTTLRQNQAVVTFIIFSPDGRLMATGGTESVCYIWETATLESNVPLRRLEGHRGMVCDAAFAPNANGSWRILTASDDSTSRVWNALTGEALVIFREHAGPVWTVAFSPDGKLVASGSSDSTIKVFDSYSGHRIYSFDKHESMINAVEFSTDGRLLLSASSDKTARLWDLHNGHSMKKHIKHEDIVTSVLFSPDGKTLASSSYDGTVIIQPISHFQGQHRIDDDFDSE